MARALNIDRVMSKYQHGVTTRIRGFGEAVYLHHIPFWRAVHISGVLVGEDEGGSSYRVGRDLYIQAHTGTIYYYFRVPCFFTQ